MKANDFCYHGEGTTKNGQVVRFTCDSFEDKAKIEELLGFAGSIEVPATEWVGNKLKRLSRYEIIPLVDENGEVLFDGFKGALEIKNPPNDRHGIIVLADERCIYTYDHIYTKSFFEFSTAEQAIKAWKKYKKTNINFEKEQGCFRGVRCGPFEPWFFAIGNQAVQGDLVIPGDFEEYGIFCFGQKFVVHPENFWAKGKDCFPKIKTCWGTRLLKKENLQMYCSGTKKEWYERIVFWHDGTFSNVGKDGDKIPEWIQPLEGESLLAQIVIEEAAKIAAGIKDFSEVVCADGSRVVLQWKPTDKKKTYKSAQYVITLLTENGKQMKNWIEFIPHPRHKSLEDFLDSIIGREVPTVPLEEEVTIRDLNPNDSQTRKKYCVSKITKILEIERKGKPSNPFSFKKWAGFFSSSPKREE